MKKWQVVALTVMPFGFIVLGGIAGYKVWKVLREEKKQRGQVPPKED